MVLYLLHFWKERSCYCEHFFKQKCWPSFFDGSPWPQDCKKKTTKKCLSVCCLSLPDLRKYYNNLADFLNLRFLWKLAVENMFLKLMHSFDSNVCYSHASASFSAGSSKNFVFLFFGLISSFIFELKYRFFFSYLIFLQRSLFFSYIYISK